MAPKTATVFSLALFPPVFLFQRVVNADVVLVLSNRRLDDKSPANQCVIRSAVGGTRKIEIPVLTKGMPIDQVAVAERSTWFPKMQNDLRSAYKGLPNASAASELLEASMLGITSPWLTDPLMCSFVMTLEWLGWQKKIVRGDTLERGRRRTESEYELALCLDHGCERFVVGKDQEINDRKPFRSKGVTVVAQQWHGTATLPAHDSILDAIARFSAADILERMQQT